MKHVLYCAIVIAAVSVVGCKPSVEARYVVGDSVQKLDAALQRTVAEHLEEHSGTPQAPKLVGVDDMERRHLVTGRDLYTKHCERCHGYSGDGNGVAARYMYPRPRDYRKGLFKFTSTPYGSRPRREDLLKTLERGILGTSMPSFTLLPAKEIEAIVDYVMVLTLRGELEGRLAYEASFEETIDPEVVPDLIESVLMPWQTAEKSEVHPLTLQPELTAASVIEGRKAFLTKGCSKCHGEDGRGQTRENIGIDTWGFSTKAADLTSGLLHGGGQPIDIYRRISSGINGTPMPGFRESLKTEPDTIWNLVAYVLYVSGQRRSGIIPTPGAFTKQTPESGTVVTANTVSVE